MTQNNTLAMQENRDFMIGYYQNFIEKAKTIEISDEF